MVEIEDNKANISNYNIRYCVENKNIKGIVYVGKGIM